MSSVDAVILGADGQLGRALQRATPEGVRIEPSTRARCPITDPDAVAALLDAFAPRAVINCAAYNDVDGCEREPGASLARAVNADAPTRIAAMAAERDIRMIHFSSDYVFDGTLERPYRPDDPVSPISAYGRSKADGEQAVHAASADHVVVRVSRLYGAGGEGDLVERWLSRMRNRDTLLAVADRRGSFTWVPELARVMWRLMLRDDAGGIHHWADAGDATWYEFACSLARLARETGRLRRVPRIEPVPAETFDEAAPRPANSALDCRATSALLGVEQLPWRTRLAQALRDARDGRG
jgi:dTDP-4-dehydrorhamnose reductase